MNNSVSNSQNSFFNTEKSLKLKNLSQNNDRSLSQTLKVQLIEKLENENMLIKKRVEKNVLVIEELEKEMEFIK